MSIKDNIIKLYNFNKYRIIETRGSRSGIYNKTVIDANGNLCTESVRLFKSNDVEVMYKHTKLPIDRDWNNPAIRPQETLEHIIENIDKGGSAAIQLTGKMCAFDVDKDVLSIEYWLEVAKKYNLSYQITKGGIHILFEYDAAIVGRDAIIGGHNITLRTAKSSNILGIKEKCFIEKDLVNVSDCEKFPEFKDLINYSCENNEIAKAKAKEQFKAETKGFTNDYHNLIKSDGYKNSNYVTKVYKLISLCSLYRRASSETFLYDLAYQSKDNFISKHKIGLSIKTLINLNLIAFHHNPVDVYSNTEKRTKNKEKLRINCMYNMIGMYRICKHEFNKVLELLEIAYKTVRTLIKNSAYFTKAFVEMFVNIFLGDMNAITDFAIFRCALFGLLSIFVNTYCKSVAIPIV